MLRFESVNYRAKVWLNGKPLGLHVGAYLPFELRAKSVQRKGVNRLVVRVDSRRQKFDIPPLSQRATGAFEGGWWNYSGILREVYLRRVDQLRLRTRCSSSPRLRCRTLRGAGERRASASANVNRRAATAAITGQHRRQAACASARTACPGRGEHRFRARVRIRNPRLWSPERPDLYTGRLQLRTASGRVVQNYTRPHRHPHAPGQPPRARPAQRPRREPARREHARGLPQPRRRADARRRCGANISHLRELGATITRSHYPLHPYALELADRYGILVWSEIPVFRMASRLFAISEVRDKALRMLRTRSSATRTTRR